MPRLDERAIAGISFSGRELLREVHRRPSAVASGFPTRLSERTLSFSLHSTGGELVGLMQGGEIRCRCDVRIGRHFATVPYRRKGPTGPDKP